MTLNQLKSGQSAVIDAVGGEESLDSIFWTWELYREQGLH